MSQQEPSSLRGQAMAAAHVEQQERFDFIQGLPHQQLAILRKMLVYFTELDDPADLRESLYYTIGVCDTVQKVKNGRCVCGEDHTGDALRTVIETAAVAAPKVETPAQLSEEVIQHLLATYRVTRLPDGRVQCKDCTVIYPSLDDRMLRSPEVCHGCQHRAAHG